VNGEEHSLERVLPLVKEHGAAVIGLCMDGSGIPATAEGRLAVAGKIIEEAAQRGIPTEDVVIDPLVLTLATDSTAGRVALETVRLVVREFGVNVTMGASNSSFGLPDREAINTAFITLAIEAGVTCPIANPVCRGVMDAVRAADLLLGKDEGGARWIAAYRARRKASG
jgi:5-methyltetrahydrofolate--homocysteine methyltransferase